MVWWECLCASTLSQLRTERTITKITRYFIFYTDTSLDGNTSCIVITKEQPQFALLLMRSFHSSTCCTSFWLVLCVHLSFFSSPSSARSLTLICCLWFFSGQWARTIRNDYWRTEETEEWLLEVGSIEREGEMEKLEIQISGHGRESLGNTWNE